MEDAAEKEMHSTGERREGEKGRSQSGREEGEAMVRTPLARQDAAVGHRSGDMRVLMWANVSNGRVSSKTTVFKHPSIFYHFMVVSQTTTRAHT